MPPKSALTFPIRSSAPTTKVTSVSATRPVNPPGASPVLTEEQIWEGVKIKLRNIQLFAPDIIEHCEVIEDHGNKILRQIKFTNNKTLIDEPCTFWPCAAARGHFGEGKDITDAISYGPNDELWFSITFAGVIPSSVQTENMSAKEVARRVGLQIDGIIEKIRELVRDGTITA